MLLVIDTCFSACSAALYDEVRACVLASSHDVMERGHAEVLGPMVEGLFDLAGVKPEALSRIVVTYGPGTFTGLRIGLSFAKGMALALNVPLIGIDSLTATAAPYFRKQESFAIALPAGGTGLFYWALFDGENAVPVIGPALASMADLSQRTNDVLPATGPHAEYFSAYAATLAVKGKTVEPLYLRPPDAKPSVSIDASSAHVRIATDLDIPAMAKIHAAGFATGWTVADLGGILAVPGAAAMVVELAGTVYGFVQFQWVAGEAEINTICVLPNYRRQHFGQDLMRGLVTHLQSVGTTKLFLEVAENNTAARGLYAGFGFQVNGIRKGYYADGQNAVTMIKEITA
jgi:tRNA threonylcarbamoyl adenosine modification protein YeaZ/ribosomal-protein-alanine acetyltransferase